VVGNILDARKHGVLPFLEDNWRRYGDVFRVRMGFNALVVAHPDGIERVLASHSDNYIKGSSYDGVRRVIGEGLLALEGEAWRKRRKLIQPAFHRGELGEMARIMVESGRSYFDELKRRLPEGGVVDIHREMVGLTLDVVVAALFGQQLQGDTSVSYEALGAALELVSEKSNGIPLPEWLPTAGNRKFKRTMAELEHAIYGVIARGREREEADGTLLSMLLSARDADTGAPLSDREIRNEVFTLFVAGHETTALTLTWLFTLLDGRDDVIEKMRAEAERVLGDRDPGFEDYPQLSYIRQVVDETLRLRGPVAVNIRTALADDNILGVKVHAGDQVMPFFWGAHRHPDFWDDPLKFDPDRFSKERSSGRDNWSYLPFSGGKRVCIGNTFSLVETTLLLAMLVQRTDFRMVPGQTVEPNMIATVRPSAPVKVDVRWR
jgi:cytochrome P450